MKTVVDLIKGAWSLALAAPWLVIAAAIASAVAGLVAPNSALAGLNAWLAAHMPPSIGLLLVFFLFAGVAWHSLPVSAADRRARANRNAKIAAIEAEQLRLNQGNGFRVKGV